MNPADKNTHIDKAEVLMGVEQMRNEINKSYYQIRQLAYKRKRQYELGAKRVARLGRRVSFYIRWLVMTTCKQRLEEGRRILRMLAKGFMYLYSLSS